MKTDLTFLPEHKQLELKKNHRHHQKHCVRRNDYSFRQLRTQ